MGSYVHPEYGLLGLIQIPSTAPFRETLGWLTDITDAYDGGEERLKLRTKPRQQFSFQFTAQPKYSREIYNTVYGGQVRRWGIPLWPQARAAGNLGETQTVLPVDTRYSDFRVGDAVLILGSCEVWYVGFIDALTDSTITLTEELPLSIGGAYCVPLRTGRLTTSGQKSTSGYGAVWSLGFEVDDNLLWDPTAPDQYFGDDIYLQPNLLEGDSTSENIFTERETFDFELGTVKAFTPWDNSRTSRNYRALTHTDAQAWALRGWLHRRAGRYRRFWQPTFESDIRLASSGGLTSTVQVYSDGRNPWAMNRINLAFGLRDGTWLPRRVTADSAVTLDTRQFTLNDPLNVNADDIICISYLGLRRLEADSIDLNWQGNGVLDMSVPVLELSP